MVPMYAFVLGGLGVAILIQNHIYRRKAHKEHKMSVAQQQQLDAKLDQVATVIGNVKNDVIKVLQELKDANDQTDEVDLQPQLDKLDEIITQLSGVDDLVPNDTTTPTEPTEPTEPETPTV